MSDEKQIGHVVSHTHWDREWRYPIWKTRDMLVDCLDGLLDLLRNDRKYRAFLLDGQVAPIEDYLQIRPENRRRITQAIRDGRLFVGPWFTLPDEYPVDGECLVRNLLVGQRVAARYGAVLQVGYTSFGWGQTAQLPQIYAGFGMDSALIGKRVSQERAPRSEFWWEAPDGTRLLTTRLGDFGRQNFFFTCTLPVCFGDDILPSDWTFDWSTGGLPFRPADEASVDMDYFRARPSDGFHPEKLKQALDDAWATTQATGVPGHRFLGDGCDFAAPQPTVTLIIEEANKLSDDRELRHSTLPDFMQALKDNVDPRAPRVVQGELRDGPASQTSGNALATRSYLKRANRHAQNRLIRRAEPLAALAWAAGAPYEKPFLDLAWDYLLKAQPHDSINGVTQDKTARDVMYRLEQVQELSAIVEDKATLEFLKRIDFGGAAPGEQLLVLFNPLPFERAEIVKVIADTPVEKHVAIVTLEEDGRRVAVQRQSRERDLRQECDPNARPRKFHVDRHTFYLDTGPVPAGGFKVLRFGESGEGAEEWALPETAGENLLTAPGVLENEHLKVSLNGDGTFDLLDKETGRRYERQLGFEDGGDVGDYWIRRLPARDRVFHSRGCPARWWAEDCGPLAATLASEVVLTLPARALPDHSGRSEETRALKILTHLTLRRDSRVVELRVRFDQQIEDHRLRVLFPSGLEKATHACAEGHFHVDRRPIAPRENKPGDGRFWREMQTLPMQSFVDVSDGECGLAVINDGLCEYEVIDNSERTIAITLLRAMRNWICSGNSTGNEFPTQKGGQCLGPQEFRLALRPHRGDWEEGGVYREAQRFNLPVRPVQCGPGAGKHFSPRESLLEVAPAELVVTALKQAEDGAGLILRLFNPTDRAVEGVVSLKAPIAKARSVNLNEEPLKNLRLGKGKVLTLKVAPHKIATVHFALKPRAS